MMIPSDTMSEINNIFELHYLRQCFIQFPPCTPTQLEYMKKDSVATVLHVGWTCYVPFPFQLYHWYVRYQLLLLLYLTSTYCVVCAPCRQQKPQSWSSGGAGGCIRLRHDTSRIESSAKWMLCIGTRSQCISRDRFILGLVWCSNSGWDKWRRKLHRSGKETSDRWDREEEEEMTGKIKS